MKYYVIKIIEGDKNTKSIYEHEDMNAAIASYHSIMSTEMKNDKTKSVQVLVINSENGILVTDKYINENYVEPNAEKADIVTPTEKAE